AARVDSRPRGHDAGEAPRADREAPAHRPGDRRRRYPPHQLDPQGGASVEAPPFPLEMTMKFRTWMGEQAVLITILIVASAQQLHSLRLSTRSVALVVFSAVVTFAGHKVRSMADRQAEADAAAGYTHAPMTCLPKVKVWGMIAFVCGLMMSV